MKNTKHEAPPYPLDKLSLSRADNATPQQLAECKKFPYRRIVGQLMYGMVRTIMTIMYAINVLSRYGNNPGPRHIEFAKHLLCDPHTRTGCTGTGVRSDRIEDDPIHPIHCHDTCCLYL